ncbi:hypothetical protein JTE90_026208, partial [Oedothorax gibbosus]
GGLNYIFENRLDVRKFVLIERPLELVQNMRPIMHSAQTLSPSLLG